MRTTAIIASVLALTACIEPNPAYDPGSPAVEPDGSTLKDGPDPGLEMEVEPAASDLDPLPPPDTGVPCGPATCGGCCTTSGICLEGTADTACGAGGAGCSWCADGATCESQQCVPVAPVVYQVLLVSASLNGGAWPACFESACDLYLEITFDKKKHKSSTVSDQNSPIWNPPELLFEAPEQDLVSAPVIATLKDDDYGPDQTVGICELTLDASSLSTGAITVPCFAGPSPASQSPTASVILLLL